MYHISFLWKVFGVSLLIAAYCGLQTLQIIEKFFKNAHTSVKTTTRDFCKVIQEDDSRLFCSCNIVLNHTRICQLLTSRMTNAYPSFPHKNWLNCALFSLKCLSNKGEIDYFSTTFVQSIPGESAVKHALTLEADTWSSAIAKWHNCCSSLSATSNSLLSFHLTQF